MVFHHKQPFDPAGNVYASSVARTMKGQSISTWDMFTRETLQNSWDARDRKSHEDGVTFAIELLELDQEGIDCLRNEIFGNDFEGIPKLGSALKSSKLDVLKVSDAGTVGLRGPTVATSDILGPSDFVSFVRNIGRSDSKELAGGTYGFGKGVFFIVSQVQTIVVYTRTIDEFGNPVSRLISMANSDDFIQDHVSYTGRHWWGVQATGEAGGNTSTYAEPFTGEKADRLARLLKLDLYFSDERTTGTSVLVLSPSLENQDAEDIEQLSRDEAMKVVAESLTRWAWPHMLGKLPELDPIDFIVKLDGNHIDIPSPEEDPALQRFIFAYNLIRESGELTANTWTQKVMGRVAKLETSRPRKAPLGVLAVCDLIHGGFKADETVIREDINSQIALVRSPQIVVQYKRGPSNETGTPYAGVFMADPEMDKVFAKSEPAAHHEWNYQTIQTETELLSTFWGKPNKNNPIKVFNRLFNSLLTSTGAKKNVRGTDRHHESIKNLSNKFGKLISNAQGGLSTRVIPKQPSSLRQVSVSKKPTASFHISRLEAAHNRVRSVFTMQLTAPAKSLPTRVSIQPAIVMDGVAVGVDSSDFDFIRPTIESVTIVSGDATLENDLSKAGKAELKIDAESVKILVKVLQPRDIATTLKTSFSTWKDIDEERK